MMLALPQTPGSSVGQTLAKPCCPVFPISVLYGPSRAAARLRPRSAGVPTPDDAVHQAARRTEAPRITRLASAHKGLDFRSEPSKPSRGQTVLTRFSG